MHSKKEFLFLMKYLIKQSKIYGYEIKTHMKQMTLPKQNCKFYNYPGPHNLIKNGPKKC